MEGASPCRGLLAPVIGQAVKRRRQRLTPARRCNYAANMRARIVQIGNSRGTRIPKEFLEQTRMNGDVQIEAEAGRIVIRPARSPREGWDESFRNMAARGDDRLLDETSSTEFDERAWTW